MIDKTYTARLFGHLFAVAVLFALVFQASRAQASRVEPDKVLPKIGSKARIVSLAPAATEALFYMGAGEQVVGRTKACNYPEFVKEVPQVGSMFPPNPENILRLKPSLVVMTHGFTSLREKLKQWKIPVYTYEPTTLAEIAEHLRQLGYMTDRTGSAEEAAVTFEKNLTKLSRKKRPLDKLIYWEVGTQPMITAGGGTFITDLIEHAGGKNIFSDLQTPWPKINNETVIRRQPNYFFTTDKTEQIVSSRPWTRLLPLEKGHFVHITNPDLVHRPSPRVLDGLKWVITTLENRL